jgi:nucleoside-diphosphate-sugar epimerase
MKILITGGTGFIGRYFVESLSRQGHALVLLDLHVPDFDLGDAEFRRGDVRDADALEQSLAGCDGVLHLAAAHHDFGIDDATFATVNVGGAEALCRAMEQRGVVDVCYFSTVAVYGDASPPLDEQATPAPNSPYGRTKLAAENVFQKWVAQDGRRRCLAIRPTVTFGPRNFANMYTLIRQIERGAFVAVGEGQNIKSLSYVENLVDATCQMWFRPGDQRRAWEVFNYVEKPDLTSDQIASCIYRALGKERPRWRVPYGLARLVVWPLDLVIAATGVNLPISGARIYKLARAQTQFESQAIREAGYRQQIPLEQGIEKMVAWYVAEGKQLGERGVPRRLPPKRVSTSG